MVWVSEQLHCHARGLEALTVMSFIVTSRAWLPRLILVVVVFMNNNVPLSVVVSPGDELPRVGVSAILCIDSL